MPAGKKVGGRTKGTPNKKTAEQLDRAERLIRLIEQEYLESDISEISPRDRMQFFSGLLEYVQPKLTRVEQTGKTQSELTIKILRGSKLTP